MVLGPFGYRHGVFDGLLGVLGPARALRATQLKNFGRSCDPRCHQWIHRPFLFFIFFFSDVVFGGSGGVPLNSTNKRERCRCLFVSLEIRWAECEPG